MRKRIKTKIFLGFLVVITMLATAGGVSIYEFVRLSGIVQSLIKDNYKTIQAGKTMLESLERKDSGVLLLLLGQINQGSEVVKSADSTFRMALHVASKNITEPGEDSLIASIQFHYDMYHKTTDQVNYNDSVNILQWYQNEVHEKFVVVKLQVHALINLNQEAMFQESTHLEEQSRRALMPGIVAICAALIFMFLLNFFISKYFVAPIVHITSVIKKYQSNPHGALVINIDSEDEIKQLATSVEKLVEKLK